MNIIKLSIMYLFIAFFALADNQEEAKKILEQAFDILNNRTYTLDSPGTIAGLKGIPAEQLEGIVVKQIVKPDGTVLHGMFYPERTDKNLVSKSITIWKDGGCYHLKVTPRTPETSFCIFTSEPWQKSKFNHLDHFVLKQEKVKIYGSPCHVIQATVKKGGRAEYFVDCRTGYLLCDKYYGKNGNLFGQAYYLNYDLEPGLTEEDFAIPGGIKVHVAKNAKEYAKLNAELTVKFIEASRKSNPNRRNRGKRIARSFSSYAASGDMTNDFLHVAPYVACCVAVIAAGAAIVLKIKAKKQ